MEFFLNDPQIERFPPAETRLLDLRAAPYPDGRRLRVAIDLTPFQKRPMLELTLTDSAGAEAGSVAIVEPNSWKLELTLHIRQPAPSGTYALSARLLYAGLDEVDQREISITVPPPSCRDV
jgi:hypothetical protein